MANQEWERLKEALKKPATPEARKEAAEAFKQYERTRGTKSRPTLVSLGFRKKYPTAIKIKDIPDELERNPIFFEHMRHIVEAE